MKRWVVKVLPLALLLPLLAHAISEDRARRIHDRLTGVPPTDAMLAVMVAESDAKTAARFAIEGGGGEPAQGGFYNATVKNWATPWTNESFNVGAPLNDYSATVIGFVRDDLNFRELLSSPVIYTGPAYPASIKSSNQHYEALESSGSDLAAVLEQHPQTDVLGIAGDGVAGVMTTRAAARAFFIDGTNRAMFRFTLVNHLCMDLEQLKDSSYPADRIRQDISRSPGLDSTLFLTQCVGCHSGMDPMAQAFAYHEYEYPSDEDMPAESQESREEMGQLVYTPGEVQGKYLINENNFKYGYVTPNDHWTNYWRLGANSARIGWDSSLLQEGPDMAINAGYSEGNGAASLGRELANTEAFASCQVKKAWQSVCGREPSSAEVDPIASPYGSSADMLMKDIFIAVAAACSDHL